ncbi:hypothetical protein [Ideonella sp. BN130291]|uniref:hypothetical protein n=1 Tax=Ideonella sp. BN130291 TaxID=3112940 RepID=UPI002E26D5A6|nr:hypothetical protein [Ideonella sp. BN130291]
MDCSLLIGHQLEALHRLTQALQDAEGDALDQQAWRELRDRAAAHFHMREQIVLPALQRRGWKGLNSEALAAHMELKRALAALCICSPGEPDFDRVLAGFADRLAQQRLADELWTVPTLRRLMSAEERRLMCEEIEQLQDTMVPPQEHYLWSAARGDGGPGTTVVEDASLVLRSLGDPAAEAAVG